ncbi:MAG: hypothetical protein WA173_08185, partial [Pseudomonas sp.]|uniref:hypothetical protein n=1 Tax=Pseudomonas sp. TaxID=306 RepID=UPI003BB6A30A
IITDQMLCAAARLWAQRSGTRRADLRQSSQLLQMPLEVLERRDVAVLLWRNPISVQAEQLLEARKSNAAAPELSETWWAYEDWFDELHVGLTVIDIYIGKRGGVEVSGLFEIIDGITCTNDDSGEEMSLHISRKVETLFDIPEAELLKGLKEQVKKHWRELFVKDGDDVAQVLPLSEFVKALRSV